jgi:hypothetical protein
MTFSAKVIYEEPSYMEGDFIHMECFDHLGKKVYTNLHVNVDSKKVLKTRQLVVRIYIHILSFHIRIYVLLFY